MLLISVQREPQQAEIKLLIPGPLLRARSTSFGNYVIANNFQVHFPRLQAIARLAQVQPEIQAITSLLKQAFNQEALTKSGERFISVVRSV